ncbi:MAG: WecB/TagA/CpsF family glycosyltransferase [Candidatus Zapsychrus exili]|nr:WecB/TagA/CpsF family glycosyltransferase [Candidatus Zapsychrus exili]
MNKIINILGVNVAVTNLKSAVSVIFDWIDNKAKHYVCIAPVSTIVDCQKDEKYLEIVNGSGMTTPDGMPLVWIGRLKGKKAISRTYGPDLMSLLCDLSQDKGYRHFFYGGTEETNKKLICNLKERFPRIQIAGGHNPDFLKVGEVEKTGVIEKINNANADILWVGLGSPKQDYWMHNHKSKLNTTVMIGVGAAFDFIAGTKKQAPIWMRRSGLEWFFRLISEPKRLWRRYLLGNSLFIYLLIKNWFKPNKAASLT